MGIGASKEEKLDGTAVTGYWHKKVVMPKGIVAEQMRGGPYPGKRFLSFTPRLLQEMNAKKGSTGLYLELEQAINDRCGGTEMSGWDSKKIYEVVSQFQSRFSEKGMSVNYSMVKWWVSHGQYGGHMEYRYWLEFADLEIATGEVVPLARYDPTLDYTKKTAVEENIENEVPQFTVGTTIVDPEGVWELQLDTMKGEGKSFVKNGTLTLAKNGSVYDVQAEFKLGAMCLWQTAKYRGVLQMTEDGWRYSLEGKFGLIKIVSSTVMEVTDSKGEISAQYKKS